jgi:hypothetical protein
MRANAAGLNWQTCPASSPATAPDFGIAANAQRNLPRLCWAADCWRDRASLASGTLLAVEQAASWRGPAHHRSTCGTETARGNPRRQRTCTARGVCPHRAWWDPAAGRGKRAEPERAAAVQRAAGATRVLLQPQPRQLLQRRVNQEVCGGGSGRAPAGGRAEAGPHQGARPTSAATCCAVCAPALHSVFSSSRREVVGSGRRWPLNFRPDAANHEGLVYNNLASSVCEAEQK